MNGETEEERVNTKTGAENVAHEKGAEAKPVEEMSREELVEAFQNLQGEVERNRDLYLRSVAEADNTRKRSAKEKEDWVKYANENLLKSLLPVVDNLEKAVEHSEKSTVDALREGVLLTLKGFKDALGRSGVSEVQAPGTPFDPYVHEAVYEVDDDKTPGGIVVQELQKGYTLNGRLLRPAMVVVSRGKKQ